MSTILPAIIAALATIAAAWVSRPRHAPSGGPATASAPTAPTGTATAPAGQAKVSFSLIFGGVGLVVWFIPIVGFPVNLVGLGFAVSHITEPSRWRYPRTGIWLNVVMLMATTANSAIGSFMGYHGML